MRKLSEIIEIGLVAAKHIQNPSYLGMCVILHRHRAKQRNGGTYTIPADSVVLLDEEVEMFDLWINKILRRGRVFVYLQDRLHANLGREPTKAEWVAWYRTRVRYLKKTGR